MYKISPHAKIILQLLDNAALLSVKHHEYKMAKDVIFATQKVCDSLGFKIDKENFDHIISSISEKHPSVLRDEFNSFARFVVSLDKEMDKETIVGKNG